jgi:hypothetical protein
LSQMIMLLMTVIVMMNISLFCGIGWFELQAENW